MLPVPTPPIAAEAARERACCILVDIATETLPEDVLLGQVHPDVRRVLLAYGMNNLCFMRESAAVACQQDDVAVLWLALGLPILMDRALPPTATVEQWLADRVPRNEMLIGSIESSGGAELFRLAFVKP